MKEDNKNKERARLTRRQKEQTDIINYGIKSMAEAICKLNSIHEELEKLDI